MRIGIIWPEDNALARTTVRFERYLHGFQSLGHDTVIVATEAACAGFPYPTRTVPDRASLRNPSLWRDLNLDAALICTWLVNADLMRAARPHVRHLLSLSDNDGCIGVRVHPWSLLGRLWVLQPRLLGRLRSALWWLRQFVGLDVRRDNEVLASCRLADRIIVFSPGAQDNLTTFFHYHHEEGIEGRIWVAPYPVDETFEGSPLLTSRKDQVVAIGRWDDPQKDVGLLVTALAQILRQRTATRCIILGPGGDRALQALTTTWADRVEYLGAVPPLRVREILDQSRCLLSTSRWESGPIVAAEALLRGCSLVGPESIPGFRQFCQDGACGTTFASRSHSAVAAALKSELEAWDVGNRHPERIAACWRGYFLPTSVCEQLLSGLGESVRPHERRRRSPLMLGPLRPPGIAEADRDGGCAIAPALTSASPSVSVVVLSYNRPHLLSQALEALQGQIHSIGEILVVDNRSPRSNVVAEVVGRFPQVRLIANDTNLGFTGGMNVGLAHAGGEYILLTEDDLILDPNCIEVMMEYVQAHPEVALAGGLMVNHSSGTLRCAGGDLRLGTRYEKSIHGRDEEDCGQFALPFEVTYLPGAFMLARRSDWQRWGGFHPSFYLYHEDDELCLRVIQEGGQIAMIPQARARHIEPDPGPCPGWLERMKIRNLLQLGLLHVPARQLPVFLARYAIWPLVAGLWMEPRAWWHFRALLDLLWRLPRLLAERCRTGTRTSPLVQRLIPGRSGEAGPARRAPRSLAVVPR